MTKPTIRPPFDDADADIILRSSDHVDFLLYKVILAKASTVFRDMFALPDTAAATAEPQTVHLTENADVVESLLRFCYPVERPVFTTLDELLPVLDAAKKYDTAFVADALVQQLETFLQKEHPLRVYAIAYLHERPQLARKAARRLLGEAKFLDPPVMPPEFRVLTCDAVYALARYREECLAAALAIVVNKDWILTGDHLYRATYTHSGEVNQYTTWIWYRCQACTVDKSSSLTIRSTKAGGTHLYPSLWWCHYLSGLKETLARRVQGRVATETTLLQAVLEEAGSCNNCISHARKHLTVYAQAMERRIEEALDEIQLRLPFAS
ncbi:hypothetical protein BD414DRAFT_482859 [Trametes punicea]|nr:hypothetical protein BD414DRAFT_482859 [Trametes punicea]